MFEESLCYTDKIGCFSKGKIIKVCLLDISPMLLDFVMCIKSGAFLDLSS